MYYFETYIITIQKYYRSYISRRKLNNIYKKLPNDIQRIVQYYMNEDLYYKRFIKSVLKILNTKFYNPFISIFYTLSYNTIYNSFRK